MITNITSDLFGFFIFSLGILGLFAIIERTRQLPERIKKILGLIVTICLLWFFRPLIDIMRYSLQQQSPSQSIVDTIMSGWNIFAIIGTCICLVSIVNNIFKYLKEKNNTKDVSKIEESEESGVYYVHDEEP